MLWIVDPSQQWPEEQGVSEIVAGWSGALRVFRPALVVGDGPEPDTGYATDGIVLMGSRASVVDESPWIGRLAAWLRPLVDGTLAIPVLGICFGHQLMAHLAGAAVGPLAGDGGKRVGVETSRLSGSSLIPGETGLRVVVSHREEVKECPAGFRVVARRPGVSVDGLEHRSLPLFSFQFHPEARDEFARHAGIPPALIDEPLRRDNRRLLLAFLERVSSRPGTEADGTRCTPP